MSLRRSRRLGEMGRRDVNDRPQVSKYERSSLDPVLVAFVRERKCSVMRTHTVTQHAMRSHSAPCLELAPAHRALPLPLMHDLLVFGSVRVRVARELRARPGPVSFCGRSAHTHTCHAVTLK